MEARLSCDSWPCQESTSGHGSPWEPCCKMLCPSMEGSSRGGSCVWTMGLHHPCHSMSEMGALFQLGNSASENVIEKRDSTRAWAAMLLKDNRDNPIKKSTGIGWSLAGLPSFFLLHARWLLWHATVRLGPYQPICPCHWVPRCVCQQCGQLGLPELPADYP